MTHLRWESLTLGMLQKTFFILLLLANFSCSYLPKPIEKSPDLVMEENADYILLTSANVDNNKAGIIFYPGGLVDPHAYINTLKELVLTDQRMVVILRVSSNLAILNSKKASAVAQEISQIKNWVVGGHSLGGSVTCMDVAANKDVFKGLFLLAAYSVDNLSEINLPVLSITASNDQVLDRGNFKSNAANLPEGITITSTIEIPNGSTVGKTIYYEIPGGNHGQFGNYGEQKGDGTASISAATQHSLVVTMLKEFLFHNNL